MQNPQQQKQKQNEAQLSPVNILYEKYLLAQKKPLQAEQGQVNNYADYIKSALRPHEQESINQLKIALEKYGSDGGLWFSFNSGKDNTVVFWLAFLAYYEEIIQKSKNNFNSNSSANLQFPVKFVFFQEEDPFDECQVFIKEQISRFNIELIILKNENSENSKQEFMKSSLQKCVQEMGMKAIIMGTRSTDPYCSKLGYFAQSDVAHGWPDFVRVNPIIDWSFRQIWDFLRDYKLSYNPLYEEGYTYLGDRHDSIPNPFLQIIEESTEANSKVTNQDKEVQVKFRPAWFSNDNQEPFSRYKHALSLFGNDQNAGSSAKEEQSLQPSEIMLKLSNSKLVFIGKTVKEKTGVMIPSLSQYSSSIEQMKVQIQSALDDFNQKQQESSGTKLVKIAGSLNDITQISYASLRDQQAIQEEGKLEDFKEREMIQFLKEHGVKQGGKQALLIILCYTDSETVEFYY